MKNKTMKIWGYKLARKNKSVKPVRKKRKKTAERHLILPGKILPYAAVTALSAGLVIFFGMMARNYFTMSDTFSVKRVTVNKPSAQGFYDVESELEDRYMGRNIFSVIPSQVEMLLREDHSHLQMVRVRRVFPDTIDVDLVPRESFACLDTAGGVVVDREGMILSVGEIPEGIVRVKGASFFPSRPRPGNMVTEKHVKDALALIDDIFKKTFLGREDLGVVDVSDRNNISVTVRGVPVNMGSDAFARKIVTLGEIFGDPRINPDGIQYIDLRFRDPVYSYKRN